ncbi:hypothetical protein CKO24_14375 [Rhodothalassium salexigens DSM 2132]|nr:hypothetical protein [Rhodothalassium salexigens DSM 2132]
MRNSVAALVAAGVLAGVTAPAMAQDNAKDRGASDRETSDRAAGEAPASTRAGADIPVEVRLSRFWEKNVDRLNVIEQRLEERFRDHALNERRPNSSVFRLNEARTAGTEWANERLIDKAENYTVTNLVTRLVQHNLDRAGIEPEGTIRVTIDRINLTNADLAVLNGATNWVKGRFALVGPDGEVAQDIKVSTNFVANPTVDQAYDGPEYAFWAFDETTRVGPVLSQFVEEGLEKMYPEHKDAIHGPVLVQPILSAPTQTFFRN